MANRIIARYHACAWRMSATDYEAQVAAARIRRTPLQPLTGSPVEASWDPELPAAMTALGVAVHEESALDRVIADLDPTR